MKTAYEIKTNIEAALEAYATAARSECLEALAGHVTYLRETFSPGYTDEAFDEVLIERVNTHLLDTMRPKVGTWSGGPYSATNITENIGRDVILKLMKEMGRAFERRHLIRELKRLATQAVPDAASVKDAAETEVA